MTEDALSRLSELCQGCGLCCGGSFFRYVMLTEPEVTRLAGVRVETVIRRDGLKAIRLPCQGLAGTRCGVYTVRPEACRAYVCLLGQWLGRGDVALSEALDRVHEAQALLTEVDENLPPLGEGELKASLQRAYQHGLLCGPALLRRTEAFLRDWFLGPDEPRR